MKINQETILPNFLKCKLKFHYQLFCGNNCFIRYKLLSLKVGIRNRAKAKLSKVWLLNTIAGINQVFNGHFCSFQITQLLITLVNLIVLRQKLHKCYFLHLKEVLIVNMLKYYRSCMKTKSIMPEKFLVWFKVDSFYTSDLKRRY